MSAADVRYLRVAHAMPGRVRLRLPWLRHHAEEAEALADALVAIEGVEQVEVRPFTGSVLCCFDDDRVSAEAIIATAAGAAGVEHVVAAGETPPAPPPFARPGDAHRSTVSRALVRGVRELNADTLNATGGRLDLGTMAFLAFLGAGAAEVVLSRRLPAPPWFNLAWWAVQAFTAFESGGENEAAVEAGDA